MQQQRWCKTFDELVQVVTDSQLRAFVQKKELPTYLLDGATQRCEPLSYERAHQLALEANEHHRLSPQLAPGPPPYP